MAVEWMHEMEESIEYPGYRCAYYKFSEPGDFRDDLRKLRERYEDNGYEVLYVLTCYNNGIDWFTGKRVKEAEHGFDVIFRRV